MSRAETVTQSSPGYATVVLSRRVNANEHRRFQRWLRRLRRAIERSSGYIGMTVQPPDDFHPCEWVVIYQFRSERDLDAWLRSAQRAALIAECDAYLVDRPIEQRIVQPRTDSVTLISAVRLRQGTEEAHGGFTRMPWPPPARWVVFFATSSSRPSRALSQKPLRC